MTRRAAIAAAAVATGRLAPSPDLFLPGRVHTRLQQRRPAAVRRHASRTAGRLVIVALTDMLAVWLAARAALALLQAVDAIDVVGAAIPAAAVDVVRTAAGGPLLAAMLLSLVVSGTYARRLGGHPRLTLLRACALAVLLTFWAPLLDRGAFDGVLGVTLPYVLTLLATWAFVLVGRMATEHFLLNVWPGARGAAPAVLIGGDTMDPTTLEDAQALFARDYQLVGHVSARDERRSGAIGRIENLAELIDTHGIETVVVGGSLPDTQLAAVLDVSLAAGCELLYPARAVKFAGVRPKLIWREDEPFLELGAPVLKAQELLVKRAVDVVGAALALAIVWPVLAVVAAAVKLDSPGPVLFVQNRAGLGGRRFRMLKFRTMRDGADLDKTALEHLNHTGDARLFKIPNDPRVTRLGAWLRRWSLDELPQLWNVLRGDMSLVGPRPFFEADLEAYEDHHFRRLSAKPGITGLWQVSGRSAVVDFEEVVRLDREYIERWSLWLDFYILARTVPAVLGRNGAY